MDRPIESIEWRPPESESFVDVTDAIEAGVVSSTPHPDENVEDPKGYSVELTLKPDSTTFAEELQDALVAVDSAAVTLRLEGVEDPISEVPVGVTKVPYLGEQNRAELSVKPEGHEHFHPYF